MHNIIEEKRQELKRVPKMTMRFCAPALAALVVHSCCTLYAVGQSPRPAYEGRSAAETRVAKVTGDAKPVARRRQAFLTIPGSERVVPRRFLPTVGTTSRVLHSSQVLA